MGTSHRLSDSNLELANPTFRKYSRRILDLIRVNKYIYFRSSTQRNEKTGHEVNLLNHTGLLTHNNAF